MPKLPSVVRDLPAQRNFDALNGRTSTAEDSLGNVVALVGGFRDYGIVEALPASPTPAKGDVCRYKAATGVYWDLVYTGEETSPWAKLGGPPLFAEVTAEQTTASTTYVNLPSTGPALALPLKGDYDVEVGSRSGNGSAAFVAMSYEIGGTAASDNDAYIPQLVANSAPEGSRKRRKAALAAVTLTAKYRVTAGTGNFANRYMLVDPVRVG